MKRMKCCGQHDFCPLHSAAPELLEALKEITSMCDTSKFGNSYADIRKKSEAALKLAGEK